MKKSTVAFFLAMMAPVAIHAAGVPITGFSFNAQPAISPKVDKKLLTQGVLQSAPKDAPWTTDNVEALTDLLTQRLRNMGFLVGRVLTVPQSVEEAKKTGILHLLVYDGKIGQVLIDNKSPISTRRIERVTAAALCGLSSLKDCHQPVTNRELERAVLLLGDLPNVALDKPTLRAGEEVNTSDVFIATRQSGKPYIGTFTYDNSGSKSTGKNRFGLGVDLTNILGVADVISLSGNSTDKDQKIYNASLDMALGYSGLRSGFAFSRSTFSISDAAGTLLDGSNNIALLQFNYPLMRNIDYNVRTRLALSHSSGSTNYFSGLLKADSTTSLATLTFSGDPSVKAWLMAPLSSSYWQWSLAGSFGQLKLDDRSKLLDQLTGAKTNGSFSKANYGLLRKQNIDALGYASVLVNLRGQQSLSGNLDGSQKMPLGGPSAVRAYPSGERGSDDAMLGSLDLRFTLPFAKNTQASALSLFYDYGSGQIYHSPYNDTVRSTNSGKLQGMGVGLDFSGPLSPHFAYQLGMLYASKSGGDKSAIDPNANSQFWAYLRVNVF